MDVRSHLVSVVDDDEYVRESLPDLLKKFGFQVEVFSSAETFLKSRGADQAEVKAHRGQVMRKMQARSLPDLVTMAAKLKPMN